MKSAENIKDTANKRISQIDILVLAGLLFLVTFLFFFKAGSVALLDPDEPRYAASARNMIETGNWIVPYFNGHSRLNKPPLIYWLTALSFKSFGVSEFSARLPSLIFGIGGVVIAYLWARSMWGRRRAFCAGFILSVCPLYCSLSRICITDMTMSFFLYLSLYFFYLGYERGLHGKWNKIAIYLSLAITFLTKGHVGIVLFLLIICIFLLAMKDIKYLLELWYLPGFIAFAALVLPWSVMFLANVGVNSVISLISHETYGRFIEGYHHPEPFYFYAKGFFFGFFPWSFFIPLVFWSAFRWRGGDNCGIQDSGSVFDNRRSAMRLRFFCIWLIAVLVFFSMSRSKLFTYILPVAPAVSFLFVSMFSSNVEFRKKRINYAAVFSVFLSLFIFSLIALIFLPKWISVGYLASSNMNNIDLMSWIFCVCMGFTIIVFLVKGIEWAMWILGLTTYGLLLFIALNLHVFMGENHSAKSLANEFLPSNRESYTLLCYKRIRPSLVFYSGGYVGQIDALEINSSASFETENKDVYIYMERRDYKRLKNEVNKGDFYLFGENDAAVILKKNSKLQIDNQIP